MLNPKNDPLKMNEMVLTYHRTFYRLNSNRVEASPVSLCVRFPRHRRS